MTLRRPRRRHWGRLLLPDRVALGTLVVEGGVVVDVVVDEADAAGGARGGFADGAVHEADGAVREADGAVPWWVPGFVDLHVHGGGGGDAMDGAEGVRALAAAHLRHGTTALLASTLTAPWPEVLEALRGVATVMAEGPVAGRADLLGAHLEGPFINPVRLGAQPPFALLPTVERVAEVLAFDVVRSVTIAPEIEGAIAAAERFARAGAVVGVGHSVADAPAVEALFAAVRAAAATVAAPASPAAAGAGSAGGRVVGCRVVATHLFNAMTGMTGREPGVVGAVLGDRDAYAELIADGHHVAAAALRAAFAAKPGRIALVTDAIRAAGRGDGPSSLGGRAVVVAGGAARLADGTLAGSVLTMDVAVRTAVAMGVPVVEALRAATSTPAALLGLADRGRLRIGAAADLVRLDADLRLVEVWQRGVQVA